MQVILLERVAKLGQMGEVVNVKDGYARNFLLPQGKALRANEANIKSFEVKKAQLEATNLETRKEAEAVGAKLDGQTFVVIRSASDAGRSLRLGHPARRGRCRDRGGLHRATAARSCWTSRSRTLASTPSRCSCTRKWRSRSS